MKTQTGARLMFVAALIAGLVLSQAGWHASAAVRAGTIFVNDDVNDGLAAHWKFDENGSSTALDFLGANPAALQGTASQAAANLAPLSVPNPGALVLDGSTGYAQVAAPSTALALSSSFSLAGWVRRTSTGTYDAIYDSGTETNKWWVFISDLSKGNLVGFGKRGIQEFYSTSAILDTNWHHIAVVKNGDSGTNLSFYVDGAASGTAAVGSVASPSGSARIGALLDGVLAAQFAGNIDDLRVYNRALSAAEVSRLAQGQGCVTDGSSWGSAFRELQCALSTAASGQEIWLAGGTYKPGTSSSVSFNLVNGVNLLGGFTGTETLSSQRPVFDPNAPLTNLSGDILGDDIPATFSNYTDNSQGVIIAGSGVSAVLDGLAIRQGSSPLTGACLQVQAGVIGLTLNNAVVSGCSADGNGGGIHSLAPLTLNHVTFSGNRSLHGNGGGLFSSGVVTAANLSVLGNRAVFGGGVQVSAAASVSGGLFDGNQAFTFSGGGINSSAALTIQAVTFQNNAAAFGGGAIESSGPTLTISSSTFTNNTVSVFTGGALDATSGAITITSSSFSLNKSIQDGGAIFAANGSLNVQGGTFDQNQALGGNCSPVCSSGNGGAIASTGSLTVSGVTFTNNTARLDGGAISSIGPAAGISTGIFNSNKAGSPADTGNPGLGRGGAVFNSGVLTTNLVTFSANSARTAGGGVFNADQMVDTASTFNGNQAVDGGGVAFGTGATTSGNGSFSGSTFTNNTAARGGGLDSINAVTLSGVTFLGNQANGASADGGGLFTSGGVSSLNSVAFTNNTAGRFGGGARLNAANIQNSTFSGNSAGLEGGGVILSQSSELLSSVFHANTASLSGGISMQGPIDRSQTLRVFNSLFFDNQHLSAAGTSDMRLFDLNIVLANNTFGRPGAVGQPQLSVVFFRSNLDAKNNIWSGYTASLTEGQTAAGVSLSEDYNLFFNAPLGVGIPAGAHSLAADPQFVNPAGANFQLKVSSPAIDSGDGSALPPTVTTDLADQARYQDLPGAPNTGTGSPPIDRGAFEVSPAVTYLPMTTK